MNAEPAKIAIGDFCRYDPAWRGRLLAKSRAKRGKAMLDLFEFVLDGDTPYRAADPIYEWRLRQLAGKDVEKP